MLRILRRHALVAGLISAGCFAESSITSGETEPSTGSTGTGTEPVAESGTGSGTSTTTTVGPGQSESGLAGSSSGSETGSGTTSGTDTGSDSSSGSGELRPTVCPTFSDAFDDDAIDPLWRQSFPASTSEAEDELVMNVTGALNDEFVTMVVLPEDGGLQGAALRAELGTVPVELGTRLGLWVHPTEGEGRVAYNLASRDAGLRVEARITPEAGSPQIAATLDWDPETMQWLQLRESDGTLFFETSSDGVAFELFHEMATPFNLDSAEVGFAGHNDLALKNDIEVSVRTFEFICEAT